MLCICSASEKLGAWLLRARLTAEAIAPRGCAPLSKMRMLQATKSLIASGALWGVVGVKTAHPPQGSKINAKSRSVISSTNENFGGGVMRPPAPVRSGACQGAVGRARVSMSSRRSQDQPRQAAAVLKTTRSERLRQLARHTIHR